MITCLDIGYNGRFGNQLFQFAALVGISDKLGFDFKIPKRNTLVYNKIDNKGDVITEPRFELLDCFKINSESVTDDIYIMYNKNESFFHFDQTMFEIPDFTNIHGYFQTDKYFKHCEEKLLSMLQFKDHILNESISLLPKTNKELVSIHIRRGDYTSLNDFHPLNGVEYVKKCVEYFDMDQHHFVVFSDDKFWCKSIWGENDNYTIFESKSHFIDFCAMSLCQHNVISNSSFSWWASYLNRNNNKKVFAPEKWFGIGLSHNLLCDLYRSEMIIV